MTKYYVYAYLRENGIPYYVGKGTGQRAYVNHGRIKLPPKERIIFCETNLTEIGAYALERRLIRIHGRKNIDKNGVLYNYAEGGNGGDVSLSPAFQEAMKNRKQIPWNKSRKGYKNRYPKNVKRGPASDESRQKRSEMMKKIWAERKAQGIDVKRPGTGGCKGFKWYNNGEIEICVKEKPEGFEKGRLKGIPRGNKRNKDGKSRTR